MNKISNIMEVVAGGLLLGAGIIGLISDHEELATIEAEPIKPPAIPIDYDEDVDD